MASTQTTDPDPADAPSSADDVPAVLGVRSLIDLARFPIRGGGYDPAAVDDFLDALAERVEQVAVSSVDHGPLARRDADQMRADAARDAVLIRLEARAEADAIAVDAQRQVSDLMADSARVLAEHAAAVAPRLEAYAEDRVVAIALEAIGAIAELVGKGRDDGGRRVERFVGGLVQPAATGS